MSKQEASVASRWNDPWLTSHPEDTWTTSHPEYVEEGEIRLIGTSFEYTLLECSETHLRGINVELDQILEETAAMSLWDTVEENLFAPGERLSVALAGLAGRSEEPATQTALVAYAAQIMEAHLDYLRTGINQSRADLFRYIAPIIEALALKNPKPAQETDTLTKVADYATKYGELIQASGPRAGECWRACDALWRFLSGD